MTLSNLRSVFALFVGVVATSGCEKAPQSSTGAEPAITDASVAVSPGPPKTAEPPAEASPPAQHVELQIASVANTMTFDKSALAVPTGAEVHLTFKSNSTIVTLPHNWVLVNPGSEASVAASGLKYGDKAGYIDVFNHDVLAHTPLAKPGETSEVTFTAPAPGKYPYICTVPGHYMLMKGVLTVTP